MDDKRQKALIEFIKSIALSNHDVPDDIREDALTFYSELAGGTPTKEEPPKPVEKKPATLDFDADEKPTYKKADILPEIPVEVNRNMKPNPFHSKGVVELDDDTRWVKVAVPDYPLESFTVTLHQYNNISIEVLGDTQKAIDLLAMYTGIFIADAEYIVNNWYVLAADA